MLLAARKSFLCLLLLLTCAAALLPACSSEIDHEELEGTLTVVTFSEEGFLAAYGNAISIHYPKVKINTVTPPENIKTFDQYVDWYTGTSADLYFIVGTLIYQPLVDSGTLLSLDAFVAKDSKNYENDPLGSLSYLREIGGGELFAIPSGFTTSALFINKSLFQAEGVPIPTTESMDWQEVLRLASRFESPLVGLDAYEDSPASFLMSVAKSNTLQIWDGEQMTINNKEWQEEAVSFQNLFHSERFDLAVADKFAEGKAAIAYQRPSYGEMLSTKKLDFEWQMLAPPVQANNRQTSSQLSATGMIGIGSASNNQELAWEILQYIMSDRVSVPSLDNLPLFDKRSTINGINIEPLYQAGFGSYQKPKQPLELDQTLHDLAVSQFDLFLQGSQSIAETLKHIEDEGNTLIRASK